MKRPRVLSADDHQLFAEGIRRILEPDFEYLGPLSDGRQLVEEACRLRPDVILVDISMPKLNGIEAIRKLRANGCHAKLLVLTMHADAAFAGEALDAGANGYILKHCAVDEVHTAIREVLLGRTYITPKIAQDMEQSVTGRVHGQPAPKLTAREREVLQLLAEGLSIKEIAAALDISPRTAEYHRYNLTDKVGLKTVAELARYAVKHGLVAS